MPLIKRPFANGLPIIMVYVGISARQRRDAVTLELPIPDRVRFRLLLDGDAQSTVLDHAAVAPLGLVPISGQISVSIQLKPDDYPPVVMLEALPITVRDVGGQGYDGIAGRDFLKDCVLSLDVNDYTLAF